jgi:uncharacterized membrane protein YeaQ/YmgE (transglycosylase-associated protein family)
MLSVLLAWVLTGLVTASIGSKILDSTGASLLDDLGAGAAGAAAGGIVLACVQMSMDNALRPTGLAASLVGSIGAVVGLRLLRRRGAPAEPRVKPPVA